VHLVRIGRVEIALDVNARGDVLFQAGVNAPDGSLIAGLFLSRHGEIRTVLDSTGAFGDFGGAPGLNARSQIAFQGTANPNPNVPDATRLTGIFTGGDPVADRVLAVGDAIDGSTVSSFDRLSFASSLNNGGQIAFKSEAFNLVPNDTNGVPDVFVRDRTNETTQRVSVDDFGNQSNGLSGGPGISGDGRFVAFPSFASNLVPEDSNGLSDVYVYDRDPPDRDQGRIAIVTLGFDGQPANNGVSDFPVTMSGDGRWIGFASSASNLVAVDLNNDLDAFIGCNPFDEFDCAPPTPTPTPTNTPGMEFCIGDCDGDGMVSVADLVRMVNIALNLQALCPDGGPGCLAGDGNCDCEITVDEIVRAVQNSLRGCVDFGSCTIGEHIEMCCEGPIGTPTATASATITPTPPTPAATPTETPTQSENTMCVGDCEGIGQVSVADLVRMVNIALGLQSLCPDGNAGCLAGDADCDCDITVDEVILAVNNALRGCMNFDTCSPAEHEALCCATP
jgi:hypothetical protein